jgi:ABC-type amino acid transport substrate-binding protein
MKFGFMNYKPFSYKSDFQEYTGYSVDLFKKICEQLKIEFEFIEYEDLKLGLNNLQNGIIDVISSGFSEERKKLYNFSDIFINEEMRFIFHKNEKFIDNIIKNNLKIGAVDNTLYHQELIKKYGGNLHIELYKSYDTLHAAFLSQEIDLFLETSAVIFDLKSSNSDIKSIKTTPLENNFFELAFAFNQKIDKELIEKFNQQIKNLEANGFIKDLKEKYGFNYED